MANRKEPLITGEYYHLYNRGVDKRNIFADEDDFDRFFESILIFNQKDPVGSIRDQKEVLGNLPVVQLLGDLEPLVEIVAYCILPNHFHFLVKQKIDGGISAFMHKLLSGYTRYFNEKYERSGALFQGKFKSKHANTDQYFKLLFCYVSFNFKIHNLSTEKKRFIDSSAKEYESKKYTYVSEKEARLIFEIFGNFKKIKKYASEIISIVRTNRGQSELENSDFDTEE